MISRRAFIGSVAGGLLAAPLAAEAQQAGKVWRVGFLDTAPPTAAPRPSWDAFLAGLREHGYVEGQNLIIERQYAVTDFPT